MTTLLQDSKTSKTSSKRILAIAGFTVAVLFAAANAIWGIEAEVHAFLAFSGTCAGFSMGERYAKT